MTTPDTTPNTTPGSSGERQEYSEPITVSQGYAPYAPQPYQPQTSPGYPPYPPQERPAGRAVTLRMSPWLAALLAVVLLLGGLGMGFGLARGRSSGASPTATASGSNSPTLALPAAAKDLQQQVINVISVTQPSVAQVQSTGAQGSGIGSGEIVKSDSSGTYIVTNDHVVTGFSQYSVLLSNGKTYPAQVTGESAQDDLAVIKINVTGLRAISFGDSSKVVVGQFAVALGSPLGLQQSATFGIVSALNRSASEAPSGPAGELTGLIQTSAPINPGNSGGALVDLTGKLIGMPTLGAVDPNSGGTASGIGFAIPSNRVQFVMDQLIKYGHLQNSGQGFLGIRGEDVTPQIASAYNLGAQSGVLITDFANSASGASPAQQAGLQQGDIITGVNGQTVAGNSDLASILLPLSPGTKVTITYVRGSASNTVTVTLGERPTSAG
ncbi:MAG TPA: trypsin-like peptidase domain-containing protein [Ktedonobacterales bacterium]